MSSTRRHWIMYCIVNKRSDHGAADEELLAVRALLIAQLERRA